MNKRLLFTFLLSVLFTFHSHASHIVGGEFYYKFLGYNPATGLNKYQVTLVIYRDAGGIECDANADIVLFNDDSLMSHYKDVTLPSTIKEMIEIPNATGCNFDPGFNVQMCFYTGTLEIPNSLTGFHLLWDQCCRNDEIVNLSNPDNATFYTFISPTYFQNSSPVFADVPVPYFCINDTTSFVNTATDPDGDILVFSIIPTIEDYSTTNNNLNLPLTECGYVSGYSGEQPFGPGGYANINPATGLTTFYSDKTGFFVVTVEIKEYRNNNLINTSQRVMQLIVLDCPPNKTPAFSDQGGSGQVIYDIESGDSLCFSSSFVDMDGDSIFITAEGEVFDSSKVLPVALATVTKNDSIATMPFCWYTDCDQADQGNYAFFVKAVDNNCPPKTKHIVYSISITAFKNPNITGEPLACLGQTFTYSIEPTLAQLQWEVAGGDIQSGQGTNEISVLWNDPSAPYVKVIKTNNCGTDSAKTEITIYSPSVAQAGPDTTICFGDSVKIGVPDVPGYSYKWSPVENLSLNTVSDPYTKPEKSTSYILFVAQGPQCTYSYDTVNVTVLLSQVETGDDIALCKGDTFQLSGVEKLSGVTYLWSPAVNISSADSANPYFFPSDSIQYKLKLTESSKGCTFSDSFRINVSQPPLAKISATDSLICKGDTVTLTASGGLSYNWFPISGLSSDDTAQVFAFPLGNITYGLASFSGVCEPDTSYFSIEVGNYPQADAGMDKDICKGDSVTIGALWEPGNKYSWNPSLDLTNSDSAFTYSKALDSTKYVLTVIRDSICSATDTVWVNSTPLQLIANAGPDKIICPGDTVTLIASGGKNFQWSPDYNILNTGINPATVFPDSSVNYIVKVTTGSCLEDTDTVRVFIDSTKFFSAGFDVSVCVRGMVQLNATNINGYSYYWTPENFIDNVFVYNPFVSPDSSTQFHVTGTSPAGCTVNDSVFVTVITPFVDAGPDLITCMNQPIKLLGVGDTVLELNYWWEPAIGLSNPNLIQPFSTVSDDAEYVLNVLEWFSGCANSDTMQLKVIQKVMGADAGADKSACSGDTVALKAFSGVNCWWEDVKKPADTLFFGENFEMTADSSMKIVLHVFDDQCPESTDTLSVIVDTSRVMASSDTAGCKGNELQISADGVLGYLWTPGNIVDDSLSQNPIFKINSDTIIYVKGLSALGCYTWDSIKVKIYELPVVSAGADTTINKGETATLKASGATTYIWRASSGTLNDPENVLQLVSPVENSNYFLTGTDENGCMNKDTVHVEVITILDIPNTFSPDGDGVNEEFVIKGLEPGGTIKIFNRWGVLIYENSFYMNNWNGKNIAGEIVSTGTYFYVGKMASTRKEYSGWILVMKR
ncbi:MAG: hypothetical protein A3H98_06595 [Bacteroidetes bacterium RIFCSPLOWO2_02_FULL_36_8]|nr:MAG: hypothetical protein A3H98_06595 [Bacteroidetes bacterium RIFCSPLOWO2_02_FULL_36_8]OFY71132.1 MAG: hypothetical protein A3G23_15105 [Bacteroidetes bacterium RIFCSPLOWO2_12_FULL_37_12]